MICCSSCPVIQNENPGNIYISEDPSSLIKSFLVEGVEHDSLLGLLPQAVWQSCFGCWRTFILHFANVSHHLVRQPGKYAFAALLARAIGSSFSKVLESPKPIYFIPIYWRTCTSILIISDSLDFELLVQWIHHAGFKRLQHGEIAHRFIVMVKRIPRSSEELWTQGLWNDIMCVIQSVDRRVLPKNLIAEQQLAPQRFNIIEFNSFYLFNELVLRGAIHPREQPNDGENERNQNNTKRCWCKDHNLMLESVLIVVKNVCDLLSQQLLLVLFLLISAGISSVVGAYASGVLAALRICALVWEIGLCSCALAAWFGRCLHVILTCLLTLSH